jgi:hypothetical protein
VACGFDIPYTIGEKFSREEFVETGERLKKSGVT